VRRGQPPWVLGQVRRRVGRCLRHLLSNGLDDKALTNDEAVRLEPLRGGIELPFRTVQQTFGRRPLRRRTPPRAYVALDWALVGLWLSQLFAVKEQLESGVIPEHGSVALAIQVVRETFRRGWEQPAEPLASQLPGAPKESYPRQGSKQARYRPPSQDKPSAGRRVIRTATGGHQARIKQGFDSAA
jgi:hypothetical protein